MPDRLDRDDGNRSQREWLKRRKKLIRFGCAAVAVCGAILIGVLLFTQRGAARPDAARQQKLLTVVELTAKPTEMPAANPTDAPAPEPTAEVPVTPEPETAAEIETTPEPVQNMQTSDSKYAQTIVISAVGDCTLGGDTNGSGLEERFAEAVAQKGYDYFFANVRDLFATDDFTLVNVEGVLTTRTEKRAGRKFNMRGDPSYAKILTAGNVDVCNVANNHALDFQLDGLYDTRAALEAEGLAVCGYKQVYYAECKGVTVGFLGISAWEYTDDEMAQMARDARANCDLLIVSIHWGQERVNRFPREQKRTGERLVDAGADLVIGNHSHVYGEFYKYNGKYIIYSLGNFCFGGNRNPDDKRCIIFQQSFGIMESGEIVDAGINIIPASVSGRSDTNDYQPRILEGDAGASLLKNVAKISNLTPEDTIWMESSYEIQNGIIATNAANDGDLQ